MYPYLTALVLALSLVGLVAPAPDASPEMTPTWADPLPAAGKTALQDVVLEEAESGTPPTTSQEHKGSWLVAYGSPYGCYGNVIVIPPLPEGKGVWYDRVVIDPETWGAPFTAAFTLGLAPWPSMPYVGVQFYDGHGALVGHVSAPRPDHVAQGTVPEQAVMGIFSACEAAGPFSVVYQAGWGP